MNWHSKPAAGIVVWMDLRPGKGLQAGLPAPPPDECAEHKVCSKPSKRTICENAILAQVWLRPGVPRPFDLRSSKGVLNKLRFTRLYAGQGLWHHSAATVSCSREHVNNEPWGLGWVQSTRPRSWDVLHPAQRLRMTPRAWLRGILGLPRRQLPHLPPSTFSIPELSWKLFFLCVTWGDEESLH